MRKYTFLAITIAAFLVGTAFTIKTDSPVSTVEEITWLSWEEAVELNKVTPKKIFVDVYTDWCGWCKKMDASTFKDPKVVKILGEGFYAVKFNAEQKEDIIFQGNTFKFVPGGRRGAHQLASALLDGRLGFPSFVLLDEEFARIMLSPGFKKPKELMQELTFAKGEKYKEMNFDQYKMNAKKSTNKT